MYKISFALKVFLSLSIVCQTLSSGYRGTLFALAVSNNKGKSVTSTTTSTTPQGGSLPAEGRKGRPAGTKMTEESKKKLSEKLKGRVFTDKHRQKISEARTAYFQRTSQVRTQQHSLKERSAQAQHPRAGIPLSDEHKRKISKSKKEAAARKHVAYVQSMPSDPSAHPQQFSVHPNPQSLFPPHGNTGRKMSQEQKDKMAEGRRRAAHERREKRASSRPNNSFEEQQLSSHNLLSVFPPHGNKGRTITQAHIDAMAAGRRKAAYARHEREPSDP